MHSSYEIVSATSDRLIIRDLCGRDGVPRLSVTNDAERVVAELHQAGQLPDGRRLYYYDTKADLDELQHDGRGKFTGFAPGPREAI